MFESLLKREHLVSAVLLAVGFGLTLAERSISSDSDVGAVEQRAHPATLQTTAAVQPAPSKIESAAAPTASPRRVATSQELETVAQLAEEIATSEEGERRGDAIRRIAEIPAPEVVSALSLALREDTDPRNRLLALEGLRRFAQAFGDADGMILQAIQIGLADEDQDIAAHALGIYESLNAS